VVRRLAAPGGRESVNWSENLPMHLTDASPWPGPVTGYSPGGYTRSGQPWRGAVVKPHLRRGGWISRLLTSCWYNSLHRPRPRRRPICPAAV